MPLLAFPVVPMSAGIPMDEVADSKSVASSARSESAVRVSLRGSSGSGHGLQFEVEGRGFSLGSHLLPWAAFRNRRRRFGGRQPADFHRVFQLLRKRRPLVRQIDFVHDRFDRHGNAHREPAGSFRRVGISATGSSSSASMVGTANSCGAAADGRAEGAAPSSAEMPAARWKRRRNSAYRSAAARSLRSIAICSSMRGKLDRAAIVACAHGKIQQAFQDRRVLRGALQHGFEQIDGFLRQPITGKQIDVGQSLRDVTLRFFLERRFGGSGRGGSSFDLFREPVSPAAQSLRPPARARSSRAIACICGAWFRLPEFAPEVARMWRALC